MKKEIQDVYSKTKIFFLKNKAKAKTLEFKAEAKT